ncbi:MAG: HAMP domain-containing protein [Azospirillum sp.]|nr:HAMP domain-containing protein [Azospirillum sp.]
MNAITIKTKLRLAFLGLAGCFLAVGLITIERMAELNHFSTEMEQNWIPSLVLTATINTATSDYRIGEALHVLSTDPEEMARREQELSGLEGEIAKARATYEPLIDSAEEQTIYGDFAKQYAAYLAASRQAIIHSRANQNDAAAAQLKESGRMFQEFSAHLTRLVELNQQSAMAASEEGNRIFASSRTIVIGSSIAVLAIAILLAWAAERMISRPIAELSAAVAKVSEGILDITLPGQGRGDEVGRIATAAAGTVATIRSVVGGLHAMIAEARAGNLSVRADAGRYKGEFGTLLKGANELVEALTRPLLEVAEVMQRLAAGDLSGRMQGAYEGDLRALKANVNRSLDALAGLLAEVGRVAEGLASGDLRPTIDGSYQGAFAGLKANVNQGMARLGELLTAIAGNTTQVASATTETTAAAQQVAQGSTQQMATLAELSAAIGQTAAAVEHVAVNSATGSTIARSASELAAAGRTELGALAEEVERIAGRHGRIDQITAAITRIADKTQVLSINAGIEAARAGDAGRGFGVVAHQIGRLAEEAALAARDIGALVGEATEGVKRSADGVRGARATMDRIAEAAASSGATVATIASAITEQSGIVQTLSQQVGDLHVAGEANAAAAEEIGATMEELARMVHQTRAQVDRFTLA